MIYYHLVRVLLQLLLELYEARPTASIDLFAEKNQKAQVDGASEGRRSDWREKRWRGDERRRRKKKRKV
uniref:Uncharacterized protein n=1 Tax=Nelumbo nucifera TaxID=4432 RepID=A0A822YT11_NELNU|nr:TPA_asm: hypothetical protein HUJ06_005199 [Nelumbo nucifera]